MKMEKEDHISSSNHVGNKVLPITYSTKSPNVEKKDKSKGDHKKTFSKIMELLKWASASKAEKGGKYTDRKVLHFRNKSAASNEAIDVDETSNDSPKISFTWDVEKCSITSSSSSSISMASSSSKHDQLMNVPSVDSTPLNVRDQWILRTGNWIITDSEFVVLEL